MSRRQLREGRKICRPCPVRRDCLIFALVRREPFGMWGGYSSAERKRSLEVAQERIVARNPKRLHPDHLEVVAEVAAIYDADELSEAVIKL